MADLVEFTLPPRTAALLGVIPHSEIRNKMAESSNNKYGYNR